MFLLLLYTIKFTTSAPCFNVAIKKIYNIFITQNMKTELK